MKRRELYELAEGLEKVRQSGNKFCYAVSKNKRIVDMELSKMEKQREPSVKYREFLTKIEGLRKKHAEKDENGNPKVEWKMGVDGKQRGVYVGLDTKNMDSPFMKEVAPLEKEYEDEINEQLKKDSDYYNVYLEEETDIELHKVWIDDIPKDITQEEMDGIFLMVRDE